MNDAQIAALLRAENRLARQRARRLHLLVGAVIACAALIVVVTEWPQSSPPTTVQAVPAKGRAPRPAQSGRMNLSWAPSEGAFSYKVMLFKGSKIEVHKSTKDTHIEVTLDPGEYHWVVWPIVNGKEQRATVSARLSVR